MMLEKVLAEHCNSWMPSRRLKGDPNAQALSRSQIRSLYPLLSPVSMCCLKMIRGRHMPSLYLMLQRELEANVASLIVIAGGVGPLASRAAAA